MEKKNIDWSNIGFGYMPTDYRYVSMYQNGSWDEGVLTSDPNITLNECACVLKYAQTCFEGLKAYTTEDGHIVTFRPDLNGERMENSAKGLEMPPFPKERFVDAITKVAGLDGLSQSALGIAAKYTLEMPFSRSHEKEADHIGAELMARAGYDPNEAVNVWIKMSKLSSSSIPEILSTHPSNESRIKDLQEIVKKVYPLYLQANSK